MATRQITLQVFSSSTGAPLSGLSLGFGGAGYYRVNGSAASAPSVTDGGDGSYGFSVTLAEGERVEWRIDCGATARNRYAWGSLDYSDIAPPSLLAAEVDAVLSASHGAGSWSTAGDGSQEVVITVADESAQPLPGARVEVLSGSLLVARVYAGVSGEATLYLDPAEYVVRAALAGYTAAAIDTTVAAPDSAWPSTVTLAAVTANPVSSEAPVGLTRTLVYGEVLSEQRISRIVAGDHVTVTRTLSGVSSGDSVAAWLTVKPSRRARERDDSDATVLQSVGVVTGTGSTRTLVFALSPAQTLQLDGPLAYDVQVKVGAVVHTPEVGVIDALRGVTTRTA